MAACVSRGSATQWTCRLRVTHLAALCFCVFLCKRCVGQGEGVAAESKGDNPFTVFKFVVDVRCSNYSREQIHVENPLCASIYKKKMLLVVSGKSLECMAFRQEPPYVCVQCCAWSIEQSKYICLNNPQNGLSRQRLKTEWSLRVGGSTPPSLC